MLSFLIVFTKIFFLPSYHETKQKKSMEIKRTKLKEHYRKNRDTKSTSNFFIPSDFTGFFNDLPCREGYLIYNYFSEMQDNPMERQTSLMNLALKLAQDGFLDKAIQLVYLIEDPVEFDYARKLMDKFDKTIKNIFENRSPGEISEALKNLSLSGNSEDMKQALKFSEFHHNDVKNTTYLNLVNELLNDGFYDRALKLTNYMDRNQPAYESALSNILSQLAEGGQTDRALELFYSNYKDMDQNFKPLEDIITYLAENGQFDKALNIADTLEDKVSKYASEFARDKAYEAHIDKFTKNNDYEEAIRLASSITDFADKVNKLSDIAKSLILSSQIEKGKELFQSTIDLIDTHDYGKYTHVKAYRYERVAMDLANCGEMDWSKNMFEEVIKISSTAWFHTFGISQDTPLNIISSGFYDWGLELAYKYFEGGYLAGFFLKCETEFLNNENFDLAKEFTIKRIESNDVYFKDVHQSDPYTFDSYKRSVASKLAYYNLFDSAIERANSIQDENNRASCLRNIAFQISTQGDYEQFKNYLNLMLDEAAACSDEDERDRLFYYIAQLLLSLPCEEQQKYYQKFVDAYDTGVIK